MGPRNLELAGRIADGWLGIFFAPEHAAVQLDPIRVGLAERAEPPTADFDFVASAHAIAGDDPTGAVDQLRDQAALYLGGMGSRRQNFYQQHAHRLGFAEQATEVQDLYLAGKLRDAAAAVPDEFITSTSLIGSRERLRDRLQAYAQVGITTLAITPGGNMQQRVHTLRTIAQAAEDAGVVA
jgi:alkanesulfonate monooxygenase SsuD/methylene tetrahydromethanopterin reductase-like flavin-dependent oxidoreductase (luciferase family)